MWGLGVIRPDVRRTKLSEGIMITPEVARAHIDECTVSPRSTTTVRPPYRPSGAGC